MSNRQDGQGAPTQRAAKGNVSPKVSARLLAKQTLVIFESRDGEDGDFWTREHGDVRIPRGWQFLRRGDAFVTRQVKKGPHWVLLGTRSRRGGYIPVKGVYAPANAIVAAQAAAKATEQERQCAREKAQPRREKAEERYCQDFEQACLTFLDFSPRHQKLAKEIAAETAVHACEKRSGRVGRTSLMSLAAKADLAVRAHIRHRYTEYESNLPMGEFPMEEDLYRDIKSHFRAEVEDFLLKHRAKQLPRQKHGCQRAP